MKRRSFNFIILFCFLAVAANAQQAIQFDKSETIGVHFSITRIIRESGDTVWAEVNAGARDGLFKGSKGGVLTAYNDSLKGRGNEVIAKTEIVELYNDYSVARIVQDNSDDPLKKVMVKDNIYQKTYSPVLRYHSVFWELAKLNIFFVDEYKDEVMTYQKAMAIQSEEEEQKYIETYISSNLNTITFLDTTSAALTKKITEGRFKGMPLYQSLRAGKADVYAYLNFVATFPAKYMGRNFKFNETFATWALNGTLEGDNMKSWMPRLIIETGEEDIPEFIKENRYYLEYDTIGNYTSALDSFYNSKRYDELLKQADKFIFIARELKKPEAEGTFKYYKAYTLNAKEDYRKALEMWETVLKENPEYYNAYIGRAYSYYKLNDYASAIKDMEVVLKKYPDYAAGYGNAGWYAILAGDLSKAVQYCKKAYELDSTSVGYTVNYGHTYLLNGNTREALRYYQKTLELLYKPEDYEEGPKKDFEIFFMKGWKRKEVGEAMDWIDKEYESKFKQKLVNNIIWDDAKAAADRKDYAAALAGFKKYIQDEAKAYEPRQLSIHNAYTWTAWCFDHLEQKDSQFVHYNKALELARRLKNIESEINDLNRIAYFYSKENNDLGKIYENAANALKEKRDDETRSNNLYVLCIGLNSGSRMQLNYAESAARAVADSISKNSKAVFNKTIITVINNKPTKDSIENALQKIAKASKPGDTFIFYFSGDAEDTGNDFALQCFNDTRVTSKQLSTWLNRVEATRQCIILDAPASAFITRYISNDWFDGAGMHDLFLLCPMQLSIEDQGLKQSLFTHQLLLAFSEAANEKGIITAKGIDSYMFRKLGREGYYLQTQSYTFGKDFPIGAKSAGIVQAGIPKRGSELVEPGNTSESVPQSVATVPRKDYALIFATSRYDEWGSLTNPKKDADDIARELRNNYGFDVEVVYDATANEMKSKLREYVRRQYSDSDQLFLFFCGHGIFDEETKEGFIVCKDAKLNDENKNQYLSYADLREKINSIKCRHIFLCLDVCFGGTFDQRIARGDRGGDYKKITKQQYIESKREFKTRKFLTSGGKQYVSDGIPGHNSPFASRMLEGLRNTGVANGFLTFSMLCAEMNVLEPSPRYGEFGDNDPGSEFIFDFHPKTKESDLPTQQKATEGSAK